MKPRILLTFAAVCTLASLALVAFPLWVIQPFRPQTHGALMLAIQARTWAPLLTVLLLVAVIACLLFLRPWTATGKRWLRRLLVGTLASLTVLSAVAARVNIFEWMFHPDRDAIFVTARQTKLDPATMLMTVHLDGQDRAWPITVMAYHHVLNDWMGETPIAATY
jgi:hypothetical protein